MNGIHMKTTVDLYKPVDPFDQPAPLCSTGGEDGREFLLRYFSPARDVMFIYQWMHSQFDQHFAEGNDFSQSLYDYYLNNLGSDIVQCFMVMYRESPVLQVDLLNGWYADLKHPIITNGDDGILHCFITPDGLLPAQALASGMQLCIAWFFSFSGLQRILTEVHVSSLREQEMLTAAGFRLMPFSGEQPQDSLLYYFTKDDPLLSALNCRET